MLTALLFTLIPTTMHLYSEWRMVTPWRDTDREVVLADGRLFPFMSVLEASRNKELIRKEITQRSEYIVSVYGWLVHSAWEAECWRRWSAWHYYGEWVSTKATDEYRIWCLYRLRDTIGREAFYAGQLPDLVSGVP